MNKLLYLKVFLGVMGLGFIGILSQQMFQQSVDNQLHSQVLQGLDESLPIYPVTT